jgi:hypothetical protein
MRAALVLVILAASTGPAFAQATAPTAPAPTGGATDGGATDGGADDLARAADATAEVASVPPVAAGAAAKAAADDIDLSALGLDPAAASFDDKLNIYGFADFGYNGYHFPKAYPPVLPDADMRTFFVGNLNLYLAKNLAPRARSLAEVRFTFLPNASTNPDQSFVSTTATDVTDYSRTVQWGGIIIERAHVEYDVTEYLTIRGGHWLTPYGIWNTDHGSPVIIATIRPYVIGAQIFPEHQTGLDVFGSRTERGFKLGYHATMSNGRGGAEAQVDFDSKLAFGGRLELETPWGLRLGGSVYRGRYTALATTAGVPPETYLEAVYGADLQFDRGPLHVQTEYISRDRHYEDGHRQLTVTGSGYNADGRELGYYVLAGYRFDQLWNVMPYAYYQQYRPFDAFGTGFSGVKSLDGGLNFRPSPAMVLKLQLNYARTPTGSSATGLLDRITIIQYGAQASWVF